jgi:hypothetical protein
MACGGITTMSFTATVVPEIVPTGQFQIKKVLLRLLYWTLSLWNNFHIKTLATTYQNIIQQFTITLLPILLPWHSPYWLVRKKIHPLFHLAHPNYPYAVFKYPSKNGVFEM